MSDSAEDIVRAIAADLDHDSGGKGPCKYCAAGPWRHTTLSIEDHPESCAWRRSREWVSRTRPTPPDPSTRDEEPTP